MKIKVGLGYDIHRLIENRPLYLGGILIPFHKGLIGHSDGDCLIHAIVDALLGAMGERDIGQHFSDSDPRNEGRRSTEILDVVSGWLEERGFQVEQIDTVIIAEEPKLNPYVSAMKESLGSRLMISREDIGIKIKTNEGLDAIGRGEAIAAWATVVLNRRGGDKKNDG
ncbi:MAG: 2-C-methyl-D-erythritol 2,4-cyclodiphosphate synthase [Candidatus Aminicenantes bacterium]|nr:2-C-methyl-D-erythritol 2,4-cyclodiphosphate synthase [Candidatus Aminicenantes bacterium]